MINPMDLTGKHILITGGSSGIGRQCAIQASKLGAKVTIVARNEDKLKETISLMDNKDFHAYYIADLMVLENIQDLISKIVSERGAIDGLCHAAGIATTRILKMSKVSFVEKMFKIHVFAFEEIVRCLSIKQMMNDGASLIGISSAAAENGNKAQGAYASAKGAMNSFIRPAMVELSERGIRINTVAFAMVDTDMYQDFLDCGGDVELLSRQAMGVIDVISAANSIMFLLSDACKYITGAVIPVYAGC